MLIITGYSTSNSHIHENSPTPLTSLTGLGSRTEGGDFDEWGWMCWYIIRKYALHKVVFLAPLLQLHHMASLRTFVKPNNLVSGRESNSSRDSFSEHICVGETSSKKPARGVGLPSPSQGRSLGEVVYLSDDVLSRLLCAVKSCNHSYSTLSRPRLGDRLTFP